MHIPLASSEFFGPVSEIIADIGSPLVAERAWRSIGLSADILKARPVFLPYKNQAAFVEHSARQLGERHLGAIAAKRLNYQDLGPYALYVLDAPNLAGAFWRGTSALSLVLTRSWVSMREEAGHIVLQFGTGIQSVVGGRQIDEGIVFVLVDLVRRFVGPDWTPDWVELGTRPPGSESEMEDLYGAPVVYGKDLPGIAVPKTVLLTPNPRPRPAAHLLVRDDICRLSGIRRTDTFTELVRDTMTAHLAGGEMSIEAVAERIGVGVRTLQRRLKSEGSSYRDIRTDVLCERGRALLEETELSVSDIANALGFDEVNSFRRAFLDWSGYTPTVFARRLRRNQPTLSILRNREEEAGTGDGL
jgi:AraC-like DNA-binding protein